MAGSKVSSELAPLLARVQDYNPDTDTDLLTRAYEFALSAHVGQKRLTGNDYITHPLSVAMLLAELQMDDSTLAAAILHDVVEDTGYDLAEVREAFGEEIASLVDGVTKLRQISFDTHREHQAENLRRMLLAMTKDLRVILIKLADRLHNMRTLAPLPAERREEVATETLQILAPIAHRLGVWRYKWELEDLALKHLHPEAYEEIEALVARSRDERVGVIQEAIKQLAARLHEVGVEAEIEGRPKHFYSIYQKMQTQSADFDQILDLEALRVIVNTEPECYTALGVVHSLWLPLPDMFTDYIAKPKSNMYQALHTKAIGPHGGPIEVQIRTRAMHRRSEYGVAAHWRYKERTGGDFELDSKLSWLRQLLDLQSDLKDPKEWLDSLKLDLFKDQVFVFTPKGDVIDLPAGSTPVDFAYRIHTEVGHSCVGAKVNGRVVPLNYVFRNGDVAEIMTSSRSDARPSLDWLSFVTSSPARSRIKAWYRRAQRDESIVRGREKLEEECARAGLDHREALTEKALAQAAAQMSFSGPDDVYAAIGYGDLAAETVLRRLRGEPSKPKKRRATRKGQGSLRVAISAGGVTDILFKLSRCCAPVPGDAIVGFVTRGRGVTVHRQGCRNLTSYSRREPDRMVPLEWTLGEAAYFPVVVDVHALDRLGLMSDVTAIISETNTNIVEVKARTAGKPKLARLTLTLEVADLAHLKDIIDRIAALTDVLRVERARRS